MPEAGETATCGVCHRALEWMGPEYFVVNGYDRGYWRSDENGIFCPRRFDISKNPLDGPGPTPTQQHIPGVLPDLTNVPAIEEWLTT